MTRITTIRLLLALVILAVFGRIVTHDFVDWDDGPLIYNNTNLSTHSVSGLMHHWNPTNHENTNMFNPLVFTLWWALASFSQVQSPDVLGATLNPYLFHAASLVVHWLCACAVLEILRRLKIRDWAAAAGALVFAVHPLQTEAVAWASAMKDLLSGLFALLTILEYLIAVESDGKKRARRYWLMSAFYLCALFSKPSTVILPVIVTAIGRVIYRRPWSELIRWTLPWYAAALGFTIIASRIQSIPEPVGGPLWERPLVAMDALAFYLGKLVLPIHLTFDYERNPAALLTDPRLHHPLYWTWIFPVALAVMIWRAREKMLTTAGLIFVFGLLPVLGLFEFAFQYFTTVADRYVYFPMLGVSLAIGWWIDRRGGGKASAIGVAAMVAILGSLSFVQAELWTDTQTLYETRPLPKKSLHDLAIGEYHDRLGATYIGLANQAYQAGDLQQANEYRQRGLAEYERAMEYYCTAIQLEPTNTHGFDHLAKDLVILDRIPQAIEIVREWMTIQPNEDIVGQQQPGTLQAMLGTLYLRNRQFGEAVAMLRQSLDLRFDRDVQKTLELAEELLRRSSTRPAGPTSGP